MAIDTFRTTRRNEFGWTASGVAGLSTYTERKISEGYSLDCPPDVWPPYPNKISNNSSAKGCPFTAEKAQTKANPFTNQTEF